MTVGGSDEDGEAEASSLKTARNRLAELRDIAHEVFQEVPPSEPEAPAPSSLDKPITEDVPPAEDDAQK